MSKQIAAFVVIVVILGAAAWLVGHRPRQASNSGNQADQASQAVATNQVVYDGTAFSPAMIKVKAGTAVSFKNNSQTPMWVASDPHPTHTDYPGFDALRDYPQGETYTFTFGKTGNWGYHNHLNPDIRGRVIVQ